MHDRWIRTVILASLLGGILTAAAARPGDPVPGEDQSWYDYRTSPAWAALSAPERDHVERVTRDFTLLWGALDRYAEDHGGRVPETLDALVPRYLREVPVDPFSIGADGVGRTYGYRTGAPGNRAWVLTSSGLSNFPYLAETGNIGLYQCRGVWIAGINPTRLDPR
ncbi:MAG: hypothetical protein KDA25_01215 [Phycisphaerales bacterium]|nr:hypothetical protein [Phycisphaerales bacterium]